jgi:GTP:adenosylcobinamide-phosphate guanylyltransferase/aminoglycoside phosphotransferase
VNQELYVIVQAGGRGSRLRHHTWNKPKCLVSVRGKPILYHLFETFSKAKFIVIGDYLFSQLETYLEVNPPAIHYELVKTGDKGTLSGIQAAIDLLPKSAQIIIIWSDLIISKLPQFPVSKVPVVVTTDAFTCRWTLNESGSLHESTGSKGGIPGFFYFPSVDLIPTPPENGEFVKWFSTNVRRYHLVKCDDMEELGDFSAIEEGNDRAGFCRFFNDIVIDEASGRVEKSVVDHAYDEVHRNEIAWYNQAIKLGFRRIPKIYSESPLVMERIKGLHAYHALDFSVREKRAVLADYLDTLISLHDLGSRPASLDEIKSVYIKKTQDRVESISGLIPLFDRDTITVNGKKCRNIFADKHQDVFQFLFTSLIVDYFVPIHGDPTFSNSLVDDKLRVWFIDPRGSFAKPGIYGDGWYDFAKVYYSAVGGYDAFNRRKFKLHVDDTVEVLMDTPLFADTAKVIFKDYFGKEQVRIDLLHGLIWLALSGYVKDDVDSVIGSFYLGLYWTEEGLAKI